jgi:hypothetical protein
MDVVSSRKRRKVGVGGRGKYPGAPPHHIRKKEKNKPTVKRYLIGQVAKRGKAIKKIIIIII